VKKSLLGLAVLAACTVAPQVAAAPSAQAGCWATVKLSSMPQTRTWVVNVTPLQHGRTLLPDAKPRVEVRVKGSWVVFRAKPTAKTGVYRARVVFPAAGTWRFRVWDGFEPMCARYHTYAPVHLV
jgi:hypothetical protein